MASGDSRRIVQAQALDLQKVNEALRHISEWLNKLEGRTGEIELRDSITMATEKQTLLDCTSSVSGTGALCLFGTENATLALAKGARKENNGEWVATDTVAVIWALDRTGVATLYVNTSLTVDQAFEPTSAFVVGSGGSTASHALVGSSHTASGLTAGHVLRATAATTFAFGVPTGLEISNTPAGYVAATTVQGAINELDSEKGSQPYCWRFSSGQLFGTGDTNLTSYDYTFAANSLKVGDTLQLGCSVAWSTTAGTKSLTLAIGTGTARTIFSSTGVVANTIAHVRVEVVMRSTTTLAIEGTTVIGVNGGAIAETYFVNTGQTVSDISANSQLFRWVGKNTGSATEAKMTDMFIRHFPANGNSAVV
jgi:hypothetical protein